jgi:hypothetical protein
MRTTLDQPSAAVARSDARRPVPALLVAAVLLFGCSAALAQAPPLVPAELAKWHEATPKVAGRDPLVLAPGAFPGALAAATALAPDLFTTEQLGRSVEGRPIQHVAFGHGAFPVLLWSQMHGDEPSATTALLDIVQYVATHRSDPAVRRILDGLSVHLVPMLNPDGADRFQRRNAQGIDINRDALLLQSPEGRLLKGLRDRLQPKLGFNLHNQNWKTSAGKTSRPASFSLLAVAMDEARTVTPGRTLAKRTCAFLRATLEPFAPGQVARYDDEFEVRAFGDNLTKWGTPIVLIETGPYQGGHADEDLVRLNFVAILAALDALASGRVAAADPAGYESLPKNEADLFTLLVKNATIATGTGVEPFTGDVGLSSRRVVRRLDPAGRAREALQTFKVDDLGDLRVFAGLETIDATGLVIAPSPGWTPGAEVRMTDWKAFKAPQPLGVDSALDLALLRQTAPGVYRVERILPAVRRLGITP